MVLLIFGKNFFFCLEFFQFFDKSFNSDSSISQDVFNELQRECGVERLTHSIWDYARIYFPSTTIDEAKKVADRLRERIEKEEFDISKFNSTVKTLHITTSIGLTSLNNDIDVKKLYVNVDKALYEAKQTGRNRVIVK